MWKKVLLGVVGFIVIVVGLAMWATSGLSDTTSVFFNQLKNHDYKTAYYGYMSSDFKGNVPFEKFKLFIETNHIDKFQDISLGNREVSNGKGKIEVTLSMADGSSMPMVIGLVKGVDDTWKIYNIRKEASGIIQTNTDKKFEQSNTLVVPEKSEYIKLVKESIKDVAEAIRDKDTDAFYQKISSVWRSQISSDKFYQIFDAMIKTNSNLMPLTQMKPIESKPANIDKDGLLNIHIYYPTKSVAIFFDLTYHKENGIWKLFGINIHGNKNNQ